MTGKECPAYYGQNGFHNANNNGPGFLIILTGTEPLDLWVADDSHKNVDMPSEENPVIAYLMKLKLITIPAK